MGIESVEVLWGVVMKMFFIYKNYYE